MNASPIKTLGFALSLLRRHTKLRLDQFVAAGAMHLFFNLFWTILVPLDFCHNNLSALNEFSEVYAASWTLPPQQLLT